MRYFHQVMTSLVKLLALVFLCNHLLLAGTTGKLTGIVKDAKSGEPLVGVNILVVGTDRGSSTDIDGRYVILNMPPGKYSVKASMIGYATVEVRDVRIISDLTTPINIEMSQQAVAGEEVVVVAERPMVRKDVTTTSTSVSSEEIQALPVEEFEQILTMQAGVVQDAGGAMHIRGGRSDEVRYLVDGVPVTDPFNSSMAIEIENSAIDELQMVSGTFNAEYGEAMSGVVNIVTHSGNLRQYKGQVRLYGGDYFSRDTSLFYNIDAIDPLAIRDLQMSLEGPIVTSKASFFLSLRKNYDQGYLFGQQQYLPNSYVYDQDSINNVFSGWVMNTDTAGNKILGNNKPVPMSWSDQLSLSGKILYNITPQIKLTLHGSYSGTQYQSYSHKYRLNPEGIPTGYRDNNSIITTLNHTLSSKSFYTVSYSRFNNYTRSYVHAPDGSAGFYSTYSVDPRVFGSLGSGYNFYPGGVSMSQYFRRTITNTFKADFNTQFSEKHEIKTGVEYNYNTIHLKSYSILYNSSVNWVPTIPEYNPADSTTLQYRSTPLFDKYTKHPNNLAIYAQDKIEFPFIILNVGLRFEQFNPDGNVLSDPSDPNYLQPIKPANQFHDTNGNGVQDPGETDKTDAERLQYWFKKASPKYQISPRVGVAFPITDRGVLHFSYGHFLQIPTYNYLYANPDFEVSTGISTTMGNANLQPQRTVQYEVGLQQQLTGNLAVYLTGFYKDIRNLLGTKIVDTAVAGNRYALYINRDYGNIRGVTFALEQRNTGLFGGRIDYTYSVSEGNASDPASTYYDEIAGRQPEKQLVYLNWDQRHTLNASVIITPGKDWGVSFNGQFGSGLPYTPSSLSGDRIAFENSERKPARISVDMRAHYKIQLSDRTELTLLCNVYNLFDRRNENFVYTSTGRAGYDLESQSQQTRQNFNTLEEYLTRPDYYSSPREIKFGIELGFE